MRALVAVTGSLAFAVVGCGGEASEQAFELRIYDPSGKVQIEVTQADVVRSSAASTPLEGGKGLVSFALTNTGASKFCRLTRSLARRGHALGQQQALAIDISGRQQRPLIDHDATPDGVCGAPGIEMQGISLTEAHALVELIRG